MKRPWLAALLALAFLLGTAAWLIAAPAPADPAAPSPAPNAQWGKFGLEVCNTPGNTIQQNPRLIPGEDGNLFLAWEDSRYGYATIFAQKVSPTGEKLWPETGVSLCRGSGNQNFPQLCADGAGGLIVTWQGYCNNNSDIFAQRLDARGTPLWGESGLTICQAAAGQFAPELVSDGAGGAIITWHDYRGGSGEDIYAQRVNASGLPLWLPDGLPVCAAAGTQWYPKLAADGAGGAVIVWTDGRSSAADNNLYGQRLDGNGKALWEKDGLQLCAAAQNQERPVLTALTGGFVLAWQDGRNGNVDIFAQKIDLNGAPLWAKDGVAVTAAPFNQNDARLADDGEGGAVIAWTDGREEETALYAQRVTGSGQVAWQENGRPLAKGVTGRQERAEIVKLKTSDWVVVWEDSRKGYPLLFAQKLNSAGLPLWQDGGSLIAVSNRPEEKPALAVTTAGELAIAWQDKRSGNYDIYGQKLTVDEGLLAWGDKGRPLADTLGMVLHQNACLVNAGGGNLIMVFEDARSGFLNIYAQKISGAGTLLWGKNALPVAKVQANQQNPQAVGDGAGGVIVVWEDSRDETRIYSQHIGSDGRKLFDGGSLPLTKLRSRQEKPIIASDGLGGAIIAWEDERNPLGLKDLYGQHVAGNGELRWGKNGQAVCLENGDQIEAGLISDGKKGIILTWSDYRRGERNPDIYALRLDGSGKALWNKEGVMVCGAPDIQRNPKISSDGAGGAVIVWTDKGGGSYDIYTQRLDAEGKTLWLTDGLPVNQAPRTQQNPQLTDNSILVWEDYRYGNWDLFAAAITAQGKLAWGEDGVPVVSLPLTQYAPQVIGWPDGGAIIAWEDYRNGKQYEIFYQGLNALGQPRWLANGLQVETTNGARAPKMIGQPGNNSFTIVWEDYTGGGKALFGQRFKLD